MTRKNTGQKTRHSISLFVSISFLIISSLSILTTAYFWISADLDRFENEAQKLRRDYMEAQKQLIKNEVLRAVKYVHFKKSQKDARIREAIRERVYEAHAIAMHLYHRHAGKKSLDEIRQLVKDALRPIRFNHGRGYFFAFNLDGIETLFPLHPEMEGQDMTQVPDGRNEMVVPNMLELVKNRKEGFYSYTWFKPEASGYFPKIAFIKHIEPLNWVVGTGEYLDDVERDIQQEVIRHLSHVRFGKNGYLFGGQWDGLTLVGPWAGRNIQDKTDINGVKFVQELNQTAKNGGGYVEYVLPVHKNHKEGAKISYAAGIPDWQWTIGTGVYTDEVEPVIKARQKDLRRQIEGHIQKIILILAALALLVILLNKIVYDRIKKNFQSFTTFFAEASSTMAGMDKASLNFSEFADLAESASHMIREHNKAEAALMESRQRLNSILDSVTLGILVIDPATHHISDANQAAMDMFGIRPDEIAGRPCRGFWCTQERHACPLDTPNAGIFSVETLVKHKDGTHIPVVRSCRTADIGGKSAIVVSFLDISPQKNLEAQLRHAQKMEALGTLSGGIAHDFNNILSIIIGNAEMACDDLADKNPVKGFVREIKTAALRAKGVAQQLLSFSRKTEERLYPINIKAVVKEAVALLQSTLPPHIEVRQSYTADLHNILADATQIHQIVINLCSNAICALAQNEGRIEVRLENMALTRHEGKTELPPGDYLKLSIADTGPGIDPQIINRIFEPYFTTKEADKGSGLGLSIVHGIVTRHKGAIQATSQPGKTVFTILFPAINLEEEYPEADETRLANGSGHILWVDDEEALTTIGKSMLTRLGYTVETETNPLAALDRFRQAPHRYDLVITDQAMPKVNGVKLIAEMKRIREDLPVILCTGYNEGINEKNLQEWGIDGFFLKPVDRTKLAQTVSELLAGPQKMHITEGE